LEEEMKTVEDKLKIAAMVLYRISGERELCLCPKKTKDGHLPDCPRKMAHDALEFIEEGGNTWDA
jgi:hypothetical protein